MRCRGRVQVGCRWLGMWPTHTPKDRDETAWREHSWAWRGSCRVRGIVDGVAEVGVVREKSL
jgi:hypothetical protein